MSTASIHNPYGLKALLGGVKSLISRWLQDTGNRLPFIPNDVWQPIFEKLDEKSLLKMRLVCKGWKIIVDSRFLQSRKISDFDVTAQVTKLFNSIHSQKATNDVIITNDFLRNPPRAPQLGLNQEVRILNSKLSDMEKNKLLNASFIFVDDAENVFFIEDTKIKMKSILNVHLIERTVVLPCEITQVRLFFHHNDRVCLVAEKSIFFYEISNLKIIKTCEIPPVKSDELILKQNDLLIFEHMIFDLNALKPFVAAIHFPAKAEVKCGKRTVAVLNRSELLLNLYSISSENAQCECIFNRTIDLKQKEYKQDESTTFRPNEDDWTLEGVNESGEGANILLKQKKSNYCIVLNENGKVILKKLPNPMANSAHKIKLFKHLLIESCKGREGELYFILRDKVNKNPLKIDYSCTSIPSNQLIIEDFEVSIDLAVLTILIRNLAKTAQRLGGQGSVCYYEQIVVSRN